MSQYAILQNIMTAPWTLFMLVGIGGFAGSAARYGLSISFQKITIEWPLGTLAVNAIGCLLIGIVTGLSARGDTISPEMRIALATGFCGGFTKSLKCSGPAIICTPRYTRPELFFFRYRLSPSAF
jgi:hypothetical protein